MQKILALVIAIIPKVPIALVNWAWPTLKLKDMIANFIANWPGLDPAILGTQMVDGFMGVSGLDPDGPELALVEIVLALMTEVGTQAGIDLTLTKEQVAPFMEALGLKIVSEEWAPAAP